MDESVTEYSSSSHVTLGDWGDANVCQDVRGGPPGKVRISKLAGGAQKWVKISHTLDACPYCHIVTHIMKTTLDLPDDLLIEAKAVAARRRTTLKDMVTRSLRREIGMENPERLSPDSLFEVGPMGILRIKKAGPAMSVEDYQSMIDESERADDARHLSAKAE